MSTEETPVKTADLCDRFADSVEVCEPMFTSYGSVKGFDCRILTVKAYEDNVLVREAWKTSRREASSSWTEAAPGVSRGR